MSTSSSGSRVFRAYRALGVNSDHVPCVTRYNAKHQETYVITSVGKSFHVYKCSNMGLIRVSDPLPDDIGCLAVDARFIYATARNKAYAFKFGRKVEREYTTNHNSGDITQLLPFGNHLIAVDEQNVLTIWDIDSAGKTIISFIVRFRETNNALERSSFILIKISYK